jgi:hypothetical protein
MSELRPNRRRDRKRDREYMAWIASLPCIVCYASYYFPVWALHEWPNGKECMPVEVAHVGDRGLGAKCSDRETIPLCAQHHREGSDAVHRLGKNFWSHHGIDRDQLVAQLQRRFEAVCV